MSSFSFSLQGRRPTNEDAHTLFENLDNKIKDKNNINLYCLYDGHGGTEVSHYLKENLYKYFISNKVEYNNLNTLRTYIKKVYDKIDSKLYTALKDKAYQVGSTALLSIHHKKNNYEYLYLINLGDCRAVLCDKDNKAKQLTEDHKPNSKTEKVRIKNLGGKIEYDGHDWRILSLSVSRAFGDFDTKPYITYVPEIYKIKLNKKDKFIILGCDGLWDVLTNNKAVKFVLDNLDKENVAELLAKHAYDLGSTDNISVIVKFF